MKFRSLALFGAAALALTACGDDGTDADSAAPVDESAEAGADESADEAEDPPDDAGAGSLDCNSIDMIVPNAPGGGSDQQVRRLEPHIAEYFDVNVNVVYREGAGGATGWSSLMDVEPDGCTVSNVVNPNVIIVSLEEGMDSFVADDFTYLAWTEVAPVALIVDNDAPWETIEDFMDEAAANPGGLTIGGNGRHGEIITGQIMDASGADFTYVPMDDGIGGAVPLLLGGHVDAAVTHSSHATTNSDTVRALALGGDEQVEAISEVPTFEQAGYEGVTILTAQGLIGPPGMPDDIVQAWSDAIQHATDTTADDLPDLGLNRMEMTPQEALDYIQEQMQAF